MPKEIVVPGELVTEERKKLGAHVYVRDGKVYADCLGLVDPSRDYAAVVPLEGAYVPHQDDIVVGVVVSETFGSYSIDIDTSHPAVIPKSTMRERDGFAMESIISARILNVSETGVAELAGARAFFGGGLISVSAVKVPRIIGRNGSMLEVLKRGTGCTIMVGRNGRVWAKDGNTALLIKALEKIQREAHTENLTQNMTEFLKASAPKGEIKPAGDPLPIETPGMPAAETQAGEY